MKHILKFDGPIADYVELHYDKLVSEFYQFAYDTARTPKPNHIRINDRLFYAGQIDVVGLKIARSLLDPNELNFTKWTHDPTQYRYPTKFKDPVNSAKMVTWNEMMSTFEDIIEQLFINIANPGADIGFHYGVKTYCWRAHICFQENPAFKFHIEDEETAWIEGMENSFKFDDGNVLHGVKYNQALCNGLPRIVCIIDYKK